MSNWWVVASAAVILGTPSVLGIYDGAAYLVSGDDATISRLSQRTAWAYPPYQWAVCLLFGVLCGHLFCTRTCEPMVPRWVSLVLFVALPYLIVVATLVAGLRVPGGLPVTDMARNHPLVSVLVSFVAGALVGARLLHQTG